MPTKPGQLTGHEALKSGELITEQPKQHPVEP